MQRVGMLSFGRGGVCTLVFVCAGPCQRAQGLLLFILDDVSFLERPITGDRLDIRGAMLVGGLSRPGAGQYLVCVHVTSIYIHPICMHQYIYIPMYVIVHICVYIPIYICQC